MNYRYRGMGLNCPGDPGCPGYIDPNINAAIQAALEDRGGYQDGWSPSPTYSVPFNFTNWLNQNAGKVAIGAGVFFGVMLLAKAGR
jgi:hypothetical protein